MEMKNNLLWAIKLLFIILFSGVACSQLNKRKPYSGINEVPTINTESVKHFDRFWERKAIFKNQKIKFGKYRFTMELKE